MSNKLIKMFLVIVFCSCFFPLKAQAECDFQRKADLKRIANNVRFSYGYELGDDGMPKQQIIISNVTDDIYVVDMFGNEYRNFENIIPANAIYFYVYSNDPNCPEEILKRHISLIPYNSFSKLQECVGNRNSLCDVWRNTAEYTEETFKQALTRQVIFQNEDGKKRQETAEWNWLRYIEIGLMIIIIFVVAYFVVRKAINRVKG